MPLYVQFGKHFENSYLIRHVYEQLGYPWERFQDYIELELVPAMQGLHVEHGQFSKG